MIATRQRRQWSAVRIAVWDGCAPDSPEVSAWRHRMDKQFPDCEVKVRNQTIKAFGVRVYVTVGVVRQEIK